jgi:uncharacterized repeat protein (TIGR03803 family)
MCAALLRQAHTLFSSFGFGVDRDRDPQLPEWQRWRQSTWRLGDGCRRNLYGTTTSGGAGGGGTVFELSPSDGGWTFSVISNLAGTRAGGGPQGTLAFDSAGNLYGTTYLDGTQQCGNVFKLTHSSGQWIYSDLYDFTCGNDGGFPEAGVALDASGNIYGTATPFGPNDTCAYGGPTRGCGVVWEITP